MKLVATTSHGFSSMCSSFWQQGQQLSTFHCGIIIIGTPEAFSGKFRYLDISYCWRLICLFFGMLMLCCQSECLSITGYML